LGKAITCDQMVNTSTTAASAKKLRTVTFRVVYVCAYIHYDVSLSDFSAMMCCVLDIRKVRLFQRRSEAYDKYSKTDCWIFFAKRQRKDGQRWRNKCNRSKPKFLQTLAQFFSPNLSQASRQTCRPALNFSVTGSSRSYIIFFWHFGHTEIETKPTNLPACSHPFLTKELGYCHRPTLSPHSWFQNWGQFYDHDLQRHE
jgi:hypothetical protein